MQWRFIWCTAIDSIANGVADKPIYFAVPTLYDNMVICILLLEFCIVLFLLWSYPDRLAAQQRTITSEFLYSEYENENMWLWYSMWSV